MSLSCSCGSGDYDWYYHVSELTYVANAKGPCNGCCKYIHIGDNVAHISHYEMDEDGNDINWKHMGRLCETCCDMKDNLEELGFCLTHEGKGWIKQAMNDYRLDYAPRKLT